MKRTKAAKAGYFRNGFILAAILVGFGSCGDVTPSPPMRKSQGQA
jgi:hypothetical protein